jgi:hypothetical protein
MHGWMIGQLWQGRAGSEPGRSSLAEIKGSLSVVGKGPVAADYGRLQGGMDEH